MPILDADLYIPNLSQVCTFCRHLDLSSVRSCAAYPKPGAIPMDIWMGEDDHRTPRKGDRGIQFEPVIAGEQGGDV